MRQDSCATNFELASVPRETVTAQQASTCSIAPVIRFMDAARRQRLVAFACFVFNLSHEAIGAGSLFDACPSRSLRRQRQLLLHVRRVSRLRAQGMVGAGKAPCPEGGP